MPIYVTRPSLPEFSDYIEEIKPIFDSHILTNGGAVYKKFEQQLKEFLNVPNISLFVNGHMALELAIQALGLRGEEKDAGEVITTPFTFVSTTHAIRRNNLKPVFCDIRRSDYCIDADKIEELITDKTVAILPVHVYGNVCDIEAIERIAGKYGLKVIYDGAHAFGEKYLGRSVASFGDATMFSFHATKAFHSVEGGAVSFKDSALNVPLNELKNFGIHEEIPQEIGPNAKMDEFRAAMGICNLKRFEQSISSRRVAYERYVERLSDIAGIHLCDTCQNVTRNYAYFPVFFDARIFGKNRDEVSELLNRNNIYARKYFYPAINELEIYSEYRTSDTPVAHDVSLNILTLPLYEGLSVNDVDKICDVILS